MAYNREYYQKNKDKFKESQKRYRETENGKEKVLACVKRYQATNAWEKYRAEYYQKNKDKYSEYYQKNKDKHSEYYKSYRDTENGRAAHEKIYFKKYGITPEQYNDLVLNQSNLCACCGVPMQPRAQGKMCREKACIDHDHSTGRVRALLCLGCNVLVGVAKDDINLLKKAISYLEGKAGCDTALNCHGNPPAVVQAQR